MKKILLLLLIFFLVGCTKEDTEPVEVYDFLVEGTTKEIAEKYNLNLKEIPLEIDIVEGHNDKLEFYMTEEVTNENRLDGYKSIINYLKGITSDDKVYKRDSEEELDLEKIDAVSKGLFFDININEIKYKINIYQYNNIKYKDKDYSTYEVSFIK